MLAVTHGKMMAWRKKRSADHDRPEEDGTFLIRAAAILEESGWTFALSSNLTLEKASSQAA